jgi:tetratricopeptide (TPR) repeat protein
MICRTHLGSLFVTACAGVLATLGTFGCAAIKPPLTSPAEGGFAWTEITSRHFVLRTDLDPGEARQAILEFESIYNAFTDVAFPTDESRTARIDAVVFRREKDYRVLAPKGSDAFFNPSLANDVEPVPTAVMFGQLLEGTRVTFQHELTHHFMRQSFSSVPVWLNEGMAEFYSTLRVDGGKIYIGSPVPTRGFTRASRWLSVPNGTFRRQLMPFEKVPSVSRLTEADREAFYVARSSPNPTPTNDELRAQTTFYGGAWALVHLLMTGPDAYRARFASYIDKLGHAQSAVGAFRDTVGEVDEARFEQDYRDHMILPIVPILVKRYTPRPPEPPEQERVMADAEVHLLYARLASWRAGSSARARTQLDAALASDPASPEVHHLRGLFFLVERQLDDADRELAAALGARGDDPRYLLANLMLARARAPQKPGEVRALTDRLARVAHTATELDAVARAEASLREADAGLPFAERAIKAGPACWRCVDTYALLLLEKNRLDDAIAAESRAVDLLPEEETEPTLVKRLRSMIALQKKLRQAAAGAKPPSDGAANDPKPHAPSEP